jgi:hypothetical protein
MQRIWKYGGIMASIVLIAFGIGAIATGIQGRDQVRSELAREQIYGTPDMKGVAGKHITTGAQAREFAAGMRRHTLEATGGKTYSEMGRYLTASGKGTDDVKLAAKDPKTGQPVENQARNIWVTETALTTALNTSYFAENVANFAIVMGAALLLVGGGFLVVSFRLLTEPRRVERRERDRATIGKPVAAG